MGLLQRSGLSFSFSLSASFDLLVEPIVQSNQSDQLTAIEGEMLVQNTCACFHGNLGLDPSANLLRSLKSLYISDFFGVPLRIQLGVTMTAM